jgi:cysteine synthase A
MKRYIPGLGTSIAPSIADKAAVDEIIWVQEKDTIRTCYEILDKFGLWIGGSTGTVLNAIQQYPLEETGARIVAISPDFGDAYLDSIYNRKWIKDKYNCDIEDILYES